MRRRTCVLVAAALSLAACGEAQVQVAPAIVDMALAPQTIGADLALYENLDDETVAAFANAGELTVMADGHIWEIRRNDRLVGTLQITTVLPEVDLADIKTRLTIVRQILATEPLSVIVAGVEVYRAEVDDRATYVWFGEGLFEVLQLRDRRIENFEDVAASIIDHQRGVSAWIPLPPDDEE